MDSATVLSAAVVLTVSVLVLGSLRWARVQDVVISEKTDGEMDGLPIDEPAFWDRTVRQRIILLLLLSCLLFNRLFSIGWTLSGQRDSIYILGDALWFFAYAVTFGVGLLSLATRDVRVHWNQVLRLATLTATILAIALVNIVFQLSQRRNVSGDGTPHKRHVSVPDILIWVDVGFAFMSAGVAWTLPKGPLLRHTPRVLSGGGGNSAEDVTQDTAANVSPLAWASPLSQALFNWIGPVIQVGASKPQLDAEDLPILKATFRPVNVFKGATRDLQPDNKPRGQPKWINPLLWKLVKHNREAFTAQFVLAIITSFLYYGPAYFLNRCVAFLENRADDAGSHPSDLGQGYAYVIGLLGAVLLNAIVEGQLWYLSNAFICSKIRIQLSTLVFAKTLRRKDVLGEVTSSASSDSASEKKKAALQSTASLKPKASASTAHIAHASSISQPKERAAISTEETEDDEDEEKPSFASKGQVLNLFSIDADRVSDFSNYSFSLIDAPMEMAIGTVFLYNLLGSAAIFGIGINIFFLPLNFWASKAYASASDNLMRARDRRVALTSEVLSSIRMLKFMAWEKPFESRILEARKEELKQQKLEFWLEVAFNFLWTLSPVFSVVVSFLVYTKIQGNTLTPSRAFTAIAVLDELRFALNVIPDTLVSGLQSLISLRRIQAYLETPDVDVPPAQSSLVTSNGFASETLAFNDATVTWPTSLPPDAEASPLLGSMTPRRSFVLADLDLKFPNGQLSLICGPLGSGKTLLLLALLGEAEVLAGQVLCPRSSPDAIAAYDDDEWAHPTIDNWLTRQCAYVPQSAWLQNATIQENILFGLPMIRSRYEDVLEACSLVSDLGILEDGDQTEIGERGVNLSGGQKARVSLARAVYSRASYLLLDDVLSAVDAHTADHIFNKCLKGELLRDRTILLVSHHVQLCLPGADYVALLDNGVLRFAGSAADFSTSSHRQTILDTQGDAEEDQLRPQSKPVNKVVRAVREQNGLTSDSATSSESETSGEDSSDEEDLQQPRKLIEDEARAVGHVDASVWLHLIRANGNLLFWAIFTIIFVGAQLTEVGQTLWLRVWSGSYDQPHPRSVNYYLGIYTIISIINVIVDTSREIVLYNGAIRASTVIYKQLLHSVLRAKLRMFDTVPLGRLLNRFAKDMEGIDSQLPDNVGRTLEYGLSILTTIATVSSVAPFFLIGFAFLSIFYIQRGALYTKTARELRRLDSISKSPLFSLYGEAVAGVSVIRAFGASQRFMAYMLWRSETNLAFFYYLWSVNRWLSVRFALLSALIVGLTAAIVIQTNVPAAAAGFALTFALNIGSDMLFVVRRFTALELSMVAVERVKEYSELEEEAPAIIEPRPPASWPHSGDIRVEKLCIRYSEELPDVLHEINFVAPGGTKVGIVGPTGCGKSTLALSFFRFVEAHEGRIVIDGIDISRLGLEDLRSRMTIIPQDRALFPAAVSVRLTLITATILSGTLRSALDVFSEHDDVDLYDSLRRVHLLPSADTPMTATEEGENENVFQNLDSEVSEQGANFSQGQRQLICMARALLKRSKVVLMDEATSNVDYRTDELISKTMAGEFTDSTLLVIAHRLRTVISFDKILVLDTGRVAEYDKPSVLLQDPESRFTKLCQATGKREFKILKRMAEGVKTNRPLPRPRKSRTASGMPKKKRTLSNGAPIANGYIAEAET